MSRLKTEIRVSAHLRLAQASGAFAAVLRRGDPDAGALWIILRYDGSLFLYREQMGMSGVREWYKEGPFDEMVMSLKTNKAVGQDPDLWIVEVDDRQGRPFLDGDVIKVETEFEAAAKALFRGR